jgi:hypothetical protein
VATKKLAKCDLVSRGDQIIFRLASRAQRERKDPSYVALHHEDFLYA